MWQQLLNRADTPLKRVSLIILLASLLVFGGTAIHWNISRHGFLYQERHRWTEKVPKPSEEREGAFWSEEPYGWGLYNKACVDADRVKQPRDSFLLYLPSDQCRIEFVPHTTKVRFEWKQSFGQYFRESFERRYGDYFWFNAPALFAFLLGAFLYSGFADILLHWIRHGNAKN